jgi:ribosomal protein L44E
MTKRPRAGSRSSLRGARTSASPRTSACTAAGHTVRFCDACKRLPRRGAERMQAVRRRDMPDHGIRETRRVLYTYGVHPGSEWRSTKFTPKFAANHDTVSLSMQLRHAVAPQRLLGRAQTELALLGLLASCASCRTVEARGGWRIEGRPGASSAACSPARRARPHSWGCARRRIPGPHGQGTCAPNTADSEAVCNEGKFATPRRA